MDHQAGAVGGDGGGRRDGAGGVHDEEVAGAEEVGKVVEAVVAGLVLPGRHQQAHLVTGNAAGFGRLVGAFIEG